VYLFFFIINLAFRKSIFSR